jgi:hypothetical protein
LVRVAKPDKKLLSAQGSNGLEIRLLCFKHPHLTDYRVVLDIVYGGKKRAAVIPRLRVNKKSSVGAHPVKTK